MPRKKKATKERESTLKAAIMDRLRRYKGVIAYRIEDSTTSGIPDIIVTARGRTTWWEVKYGDPSFDWGGIQHLQMEALEQVGFARYIVYRETADRQNQLVAIIKPSQIGYGGESVRGFDHDWVVEQILREHNAWV